MTEIKRRANDLMVCINEATRELDSTNDMKVSQVASSCTVLLGFIRDD